MTDFDKLVRVGNLSGDGTSVTVILSGGMCKLGPALSDVLSIDRAVVSSKWRYLDPQKKTLELILQTKRGSKALNCLGDGWDNLAVFQEEVRKDHKSAMRAYLSKMNKLLKDKGYVPTDYLSYLPIGTLYESD